MPDDTSIYDIDIVSTLKDLYAPKSYKNESLFHLSANIRSKEIGIACFSIKTLL